MSTKFSFACPSLQKINSEAEPVISSHIQTLDRISNDTKALEERLKIAGISINYIYVLSYGKKKYRGTVYKAIVPFEEFPFTADLEEYTEECLVWGKNKDGDYRLSYNIYTTRDEIEEEIDEKGEKVEKIKVRGEPYISFYRPLIETKSQIRLKIEKELPIFYSKIIEALKTNRDKDRIVDYSPNYNGFLAIFDCR